MRIKIRVVSTKTHLDGGEKEERAKKKDSYLF